jgi:hypothetical protein
VLSDSISAAILTALPRFLEAIPAAIFSAISDICSAFSRDFGCDFDRATTISIPVF